MKKIMDAVYQTGEKVPVSGLYEVVGTDITNGHQRAAYELHTDDVFGTYEGLEVCWHFVCRTHGPNTTSPSIRQSVIDEDANAL